MRVSDARDQRDPREIQKIVQILGRDARIELVRMGAAAGFFWFELHSNVSNCNAWQISIFLF